MCICAHILQKIFYHNALAKSIPQIKYVQYIKMCTRVCVHISQIYFILLRLSVENLRKRVTSIAARGNTAAQSIPLLSPPSEISETIPTKSGPTAQPISPASANSANIAVPPRDKCFVPRVYVPGHRDATDTPQSAQPTNER